LKEKDIKKIIERIKNIAKKIDKIINIMSFCGTHEYTVVSNGIRSLLPKNIRLIPGPGCPVCVTPAYIVDAAIELALKRITVYTYGDAYKLPGIRWMKEKGFPRTLEKAVEKGGKAKPVYSIKEALEKTRNEDGVFLAIGFETTIPATGIFLLKNKDSLSFLSAHRATPPIVRFMLETYKQHSIDGIIAPGHVSTITGAKAWEFLPKKYKIPTVVSGFEGVDVLESILYILSMILEEKPRLINQYWRAVRWEGNKKAQEIINEVFTIETDYWRGIGWIPESGYSIKEKYSEKDATKKYEITLPKPLSPLEENLPGCICDQVTLGIRLPTDCPLFMKTCTPISPFGPCMVSIEGSCRIWSQQYKAKTA